jgi:hypothetical protein
METSKQRKDQLLPHFGPGTDAKESLIGSRVKLNIRTINLAF